MKLTRVTVTGADDRDDAMLLVSLSREFPFVEWGILGSLKREGESRYPSKEWVRRFKATSPRTVQISHHLCGELARRALSDQPSLVTGYTGAQRVQVNGFVTMDLFKTRFLETARRYPETEIILQAGQSRAIGTVALLVAEASNVVCLYDPSGGRGTAGNFTVPPIEVDAPSELAKLRIGWAGGIGPDNVVEVIEKLLAHQREGDFWIDMESGVRTGDRFDLDKARLVLERARPYVEAPNG